MPELPQTDLVLTSFDDGVLTLTLNRPDRRNALSVAALDQMEAVIEVVKDDLDVRAVVIRGSAGIFCAGGDLKDFGDIAGGGEPDRTEVARLNRRFGDIFELLLDTGAVVVAVVEKAAIGGGFGLASIADVVIADPDATFAMTETTLGLVPAQIAPIVARRLGVVPAQRLAITGARLRTPAAVEAGLVDIAAEDVDAALAEVLAGIRRCAPAANAATKRLMGKLGTMPLTDLLDTAAEAFTDAILGEEAAAGIGAFLTKGTPPWAATADGDA